MASSVNALSGLAYLTQAGGPLSGVAARLSTAELKSASPNDLVSLSMAAIQAQEVNGLFGFSQASQNTLPVLPVASASASDPLPGVSTADLTKATPQQQLAINNQALLLQQVQSLFGEPSSVTNNTNVTG